MDHINRLPVEILRMIFELLPTRDAKQASLVCGRWHDIIFGTSFINRFVFELDTHAIASAMEEMGDVPDEDDLLTVTWQRIVLMNATRSNRPYRRVRWTVQRHDIPDHSWTLDEIVPYNHLTQLELIYHNTTATDLLPALATALPQMQQLRVLVLQDRGLYAGVYALQVTLSSDSVERLQINVCRGYPMRIRMPNLRRFRGLLTCYPYQDFPLKSFAFFDECHPLVSGLFLEFSYQTRRPAVYAAWKLLSLFPNIENLGIATFAMDRVCLNRLLDVPLTRLLTIGFYVCSLSEFDAARIRECLPSTVCPIIDQYPSIRAGSPFME